MPDQNAVFEQMMQEALGGRALTLDAGALDACRQVFDATLGSFFTQHPDADDWDDARTRGFLLGQARRIAAAAQAQAAGGPVTAQIVYRTSMAVMTNTRRILDEALDVAEGDLRVGTKQLKQSYCHTLIP